MNVVYGASDTGKSFVVEALDFMLGGNTQLRDIPERIGYDRVFLGLEIGGELITLVRSTSGGAINKYDGLITEIPTSLKPTTLAARHSSKTDDNLSAFLLTKLGLNDKLVKTNAQGKLRPISFRDIAHLCIIDETKIQSKVSPIESGQFTLKTSEYSVFKLLLTGMDDSAFIPEVKKGKKQQNQNPKIELLEELLVTYNKQLPNNSTKEELEDQLGKIDVTLNGFQGELETIETSYQDLLIAQNALIKKIDEATTRRSEIDEIKARFTLLNGHYISDLQRLEGIREAGSLLGALEPKSCPLCGASPDHQHPEDSSDNLELIVSACLSEEKKIKKLQEELLLTIDQLNKESVLFDKSIPELVQHKTSSENNINSLRTKLSTQRNDYSELVEKRSEIRQTINLLRQISELTVLKIAIENESKTTKKDNKEIEKVVDFSTTTLTEFEIEIEKILKDWNFPDSDRVKFDEGTRDLIISGKHRASRGKGMRSITNSAFIIGILEFCKLKSLVHPGFIVLDSPLLAYREPEDDNQPEEGDTDLVRANVQDKFYEYLSKWDDRQIIVIENVTPPMSITDKPFSVMFSKNDKVGRYGYFPFVK
ncbi:hypothetical protein [Ferruginibacter sp. HRS2-29]|uniref:hypothetical protein n=1 Tax=Ferruginibacter sp. HRS2-29 TaxID=2487334 RepID=UPI0034E96D5D|nr:hypothetical protein [Ferruginibacter sp. HRS2-29]